MLRGAMPPAERSAPGFRSLRRALALATLVVALSAGPAVAADEWLVYIGAGLEAIEGGWEERGGQVLFRLRGGTLVSVPYADVDLPASAVVTWQLSGRRRVPPRPALPDGLPAEPGEAPPCLAARVVSLRSGETLEVLGSAGREIVHLACLDAPETQHKYPELGWFGRATLSAVEMAVGAGAHVCLTEQSPPKRDGEGHRVVFVTLADGKDYTAQVIAGGLGLLRPASCARAAHYRRLEDQAIVKQRGLWGAMSNKAAFAAANLAVSVAGGPPPPRRSGGGGRG
jgi:endonuclease YncB( thermonuclease family)